MLRVPWPRLITLEIMMATAVLVGGCASATSIDLLPKVHSAEEAFAESAHGVQPPQGSPAAKSAVFEASFEQVYRAASVSTSQALFEVEKEDTRTGRIFAKRIVEREPISVSWGTETATHTYFYLITVKELAPKRSEVAILARVTAPCRLSHSYDRIAASAEKLQADDDRCRALAAGTWAGGAEPQLSQFMILVRNNLIAARAL